MYHVHNVMITKCLVIGLLVDTSACTLQANEACLCAVLTT